MSFFEILILALSLSFDAFAVSLCKGLALNKVSLKNALTVGGWFGIFQGIMPLTGYLFGNMFSQRITEFNNFISFILLLIIGINMLKNAFKKEDIPETNSLSIKAMLPLSIATSIDALAAGISMAFLNFKSEVIIYSAFILIALTTFVLSSAGVKIGNVFGTRYKFAAEALGGITLILLGIKALLP